MTIAVMGQKDSWLHLESFHPRNPKQLSAFVAVIEEAGNIMMHFHGALCSSLCFASGRCFQYRK